MWEILSTRLHHPRRKEDLWRRLTATLSGIFCASSNLIDERRSFRPVRTTPHEGLTTMRAYLASEAVCTENLTPWSKLLPCATEAGLASLLNPRRIFNSSFHQFDVQLRRTAETSLRLTQNLLVVFDLARYDRSLGTINFIILYSGDPPPSPPTKIHRLDAEESLRSHYRSALSRQRVNPAEYCQTHLGSSSPLEGPSYQWGGWESIYP